MIHVSGVDLVVERALSRGAEVATRIEETTAEERTDRWSAQRADRKDG